MVVSEALIWLHIPKTAGDATLRMFRQLDLRFRLMDEHDDPRKHATLAEALARVPDSKRLPVIANLRRLPEIALSYYHHMQRHGRDEMFASGRRFGELSFREYLRYVLEHPETQTYDWIINHYLGDREADHWLNVTSLAPSFIEVIGSYHPVPPRAHEAIRAIQANVGRYEKDPTAWFTPEEMETLYRNSPRWAENELRVYGDLMFDALEWGR